jgi:hypothetical protein
MTAICILPIITSEGLQQYRASAGDKVSIGQTPGEALDAIYAQLNPMVCNILIPNFQSDPFFTAEQQQRLSTLMAAWRDARDREITFPTALQIELDTLVEVELLASAHRLESYQSNAKITGLITFKSCPLMK